MSKQRYINTKFWDDTYIISLDPTEKLLFLYFLTNPLTNVSGIYEISLRRIAFDTGIDKEMVEKILKRFEKDNKMMYRNGWLCIINFVKNQSLNPSIIEGIERELKLIPKDKMKEFATACYSLKQDGTLNLTKLNLTKEKRNKTDSSLKKKPYYRGLEVRKDVRGKLWIIPNGGGKWLEFAGKEKDIVYK